MKSNDFRLRDVFGDAKHCMKTKFVSDFVLPGGWPSLTLAQHRPTSHSQRWRQCCSQSIWALEVWLEERTSSSSHLFCTMQDDRQRTRKYEQFCCFRVYAFFDMQTLMDSQGQGIYIERLAESPQQSISTQRLSRTAFPANLSRLKAILNISMFMS